MQLGLPHWYCRGASQCRDAWGTGRISGAVAVGTATAAGVLAPGLSTTPGKLTLLNSATFNSASTLLNALRIRSYPQGTGFDGTLTQHWDRPDRTRERSRVLEDEVLRSTAGAKARNAVFRRIANGFDRLAHIAIRELALS
jgi:hypothetical protein